MGKKTVREHDIANRFVYSLSPVIMRGCRFLFLVLKYATR